jgi:hypothetical protein
MKSPSESLKVSVDQISADVNVRLNAIIDGFDMGIVHFILLRPNNIYIDPYEIPLLRILKLNLDVPSISFNFCSWDNFW